MSLSDDSLSVRLPDMQVYILSNYSDDKYSVR